MACSDEVDTLLALFRTEIDGDFFLHFIRISRDLLAFSFRLFSTWSQIYQYCTTLKSSADFSPHVSIRSVAILSHGSV